MKKYLICCGDPNDINCWSGTNFHILNMSKELSFKLEGLKLNPNKFSMHRLIWNIRQLFLNGSYGGFQFSDYFINNLCKQISIKANEENIIISTYPLLPKISPKSNWNMLTISMRQQNKFLMNIKHLVLFLMITEHIY